MKSSPGGQETPQGHQLEHAESRTQTLAPHFKGSCSEAFSGESGGRDWATEAAQKVTGLDGHTDAWQEGEGGKGTERSLVRQ